MCDLNTKTRSKENNTLKVLSLLFISILLAHCSPRRKRECLICAHGRSRSKGGIEAGPAPWQRVPGHRLLWPGSGAGQGQQNIQKIPANTPETLQGMQRDGDSREAPRISLLEQSSPGCGPMRLPNPGSCGSYKAVSPSCLSAPCPRSPIAPATSSFSEPTWGPGSRPSARRSLRRALGRAVLNSCSPGGKNPHSQSALQPTYPGLEPGNKRLLLNSDSLSNAGCCSVPFPPEALCVNASAPNNLASAAWHRRVFGIWRAALRSQGRRETDAICPPGHRARCGAVPRHPAWGFRWLKLAQA